VRSPAAGGRGSGGEGPTYPLIGAQIDYYLAKDATGPVELSIMDASGKLIRSFSSVAEAAPRGGRGGGDDAGGGDEEGYFRAVYPSTLDATAGEHRFTWDLRYFGPWVSAARPQGPNGPVAAPGTYTVQIKSGDWTAKQPLQLMEDPRVTKDGVTTADLKEQLDHNLKVMALVSDLNKALMKLRAAQAKMAKDPSADPAKAAKLKALAEKMVTSPVRYSQPELNTHITYLYSENIMTDQRVGRDAVERYAELRKQLDADVAELDAIVGPS
jgi:hypothetical protein